MDGLNENTTNTPQETAQAGELDAANAAQSGSNADISDPPKAAALPDVDALIGELQPEYRAALDPTSPDFDREQWREAQSALNAAYLEKLEEGSAAAPQEPIEKKGYRIERGENGEPDTIILDIPAYNPKLDPDSPEFDIELWKAELSKVDFDAMRERMEERQKQIASAAAQLYSPEYFTLIGESLRETMDGLRHTLGVIAGTEQSALAESIRTALLNASRIAAESQKMVDGIREIITPDFMQRVQESVLKLALELPPEELEALKEEITEGEEPPADENQTSLFDDTPEKEEPETTLQELIDSGDFIQLFAEPAAEEKPKRKRKPRLEKLVEQGVLETILQNSTTNALTKFTPNAKDTVIDPITGEAKITRGDFILKIPHYQQLAGLKTSTWQLLDALTLKLTANPRKEREATVTLTLDEYMQRRGLKDRKAAKEQAIADMEILKSASFTLEEIKGTGKKKDRVSYRFVNLADSGSVEKNGDIILTYGATFHRNLIAAQIMPYSTALLKVNNHRYPNAYYMGRKIDELKNMNAPKPGAGNVIAVKTLLENAPYIPSFEEVAAADRAFTRRIIEPFERDLNALEDAFSWEYCHAKGEPLTESELTGFSYETFIKCLVKFTWKDYPDQTKRRETLEARIEKAQAGEKRKRGRPKKQPQES